MKNPQSIPPWLSFITGLIAGGVGWFFILTLLEEWPVSLQNDWRPEFFASVWLATAGTTLPLVWILHRRFASTTAGETWRSFAMLVRQAAWIGGWVVACAWLQMHRTLNWAMALLLLVVFVLVEMLLITRRETEKES